MVKKDCIFCKIVNGESPSYKIYEDRDIIAFFDLSLGNDFHTLVVPKDHYQNIFDIDSEVLAKLIKVVKKISKAYEVNLNIKNMNIVQSNGIYAGQEVFHYHVHILPRDRNDGVEFKFDVDFNNEERLSTNFSKVKDLFN